MIAKPTVTKVWILVALRKAESSHGVGFAGPLDRDDVASGKALAKAGLVVLSRRPAPAHGTQASLTDEGRAVVDEIVRSCGERREV